MLSVQKIRAKKKLIAKIGLGIGQPEATKKLVLFISLSSQIRFMREVALSAKCCVVCRLLKDFDLAPLITYGQASSYYFLIPG